MVDESHQAQDTAAEAGHSMGRSMGASFGGSFGGSMGSSMNMTQSMRKKMALMGEHFGSWNKSAVIIRWVNRRRVVLTPKIIMEVRIIRKLAHENVAKFIGGCLDENHVGMMYEMCTKGPLPLMFEGEARAKMDWTIRMSWIKDIVSGMIYLHSSPVGTHSRLTSHCCYIDSRFTLKITDYGIPTIFTQTLSEFWTSKRSPSHANSLLWTAPEVLRAAAEGLVGPAIYTKESDVYSFGIILQEMALRSKPYNMYTAMKSSEIVDEVRKGASTSGVQFRPRFNDDGENVPVKIIELAQRCWAEEASQRPLFDKIRVAVRNVAKDMSVGSCFLQDCSV
ncbi:hypothetical protein RvY_01811-1 [Ramazzottius varieornatus]|uniref:guanylate cyclase n=1 Tax=Ramazzottius varieornatus TaxID=947166 RepID=A0A1D1UHS9_RAMVA|nr:hypothetical protein RvY_01811-1 [Ramazzottius varieornatus]